MISLAYKISRCLSANHYPELRRVICTGVTFFALVLHLNCTALSQSESGNFFMCIINNKYIARTEYQVFLFMKKKQTRGNQHSEVKRTKTQHFGQNKKICQFMF